MAEVPNIPLAENLNTKNGNFICGVVEGNNNKSLIIILYA